MRSRLLLVLLLALSIAPARAGQPKLELWVYCATNLLVDDNVSKLDALWRRAAKAGYTKVLLTDSKFAKLGDMEPRYMKNLEKTRALAAELGLEIVPALFDVGYSNNLLWHDPDLAEGQPVRGALFEVHRGEARLVPDPPVSFREKFDWKDDSVALADGVATAKDFDGNARLVQKLEVAKFRCYHIAVEIETEGFTGEPRIQVLDAKSGHPLHYKDLGVERTQSWKEHHVVFDSYESEAVNVYFGCWGGGKGTLRWRKWKIEEVGLLNVLRRAGAPCVVEGKVEGKDYERIVDPKMGSVPWKGEYTVWHEPPTIKTKLKDGTKLRVSWYFPAIFGKDQVMCCISEPRTRALLEDEAKRMREAFGARGYMMSFDEIRSLGWDESCAKKKEDAGKLLAECARSCTKLLAGSQVYTWSDMFDPHHNAHAGYYLVRGDLAGSWEGLDKSVAIVNWNFDKKEESLRFFAGRGHKQVIAGYYDGKPEDVKKWLEAAEGVPGVVGVMYTTWRGAFDDLEAFAKACRD